MESTDPADLEWKAHLTLGWVELYLISAVQRLTEVIQRSPSDEIVDSI